MVDSWTISPTLSSKVSKYLETIFDELRRSIDLSEASDWTPLHCAARKGNARMVDILLKLGADVNKTTNYGSTPILFACQASCGNCIETILRYKPDLNKKNSLGETPLNTFIKNYRYLDRYAILKKMLDGGADPNTTDRDGNSALSILAGIFIETSFVKSNIGKLLIQYDGDVNAKNKEGITALHKAVVVYSESFLELLLNNDAIIDIPSNANITPIILAVYMNNQEALETIGRHIILKYCGETRIPINSRDFSSIITHSESVRNFKEQCDNEILSLKSKYLGESNITFYDILVSDTERIAKYLRNRDVINAFHHFDLWDTILGDRLLENYYNGLHRYKSEQIGYEILQEEYPSLPLTCMDIVISYLTEYELYKLKQPDSD
ncbi:hypothetical protein WA026_014578 [Henosepilachna vigintioctopunctata]|uniref:Ankyrin repeat protein n=1 Tax=Henosepilachna vigintioctopunctata TaxID=420089 RepID=A0AAW1VGA7_9CUCU